LTSMAFGKGRTSTDSAQARYASVPHSPAGALRRRP
jgi:hypothetical protein